MINVFCLFHGQHDRVIPLIKIYYKLGIAFVWKKGKSTLKVRLEKHDLLTILVTHTPPHPFLEKFLIKIKDLLHKLTP